MTAAPPPEMDASFEDAKRRRIAELIPNARAGAYEKAFAHDYVSGRCLAEREGDAISVQFVLGDFQGASQVGIIHSHPNAMPPSEDDWNALINFDEIRETIVVGTQAVFSLSKVLGWKLPDEIRPLWDARKGQHEQTFVAELFLDELHKALTQRFLSEGEPDEAEESAWVVEAARLANRLLGQRLAINYKEVFHE